MTGACWDSSLKKKDAEKDSTGNDSSRQHTQDFLSVIIQNVQEVTEFFSPASSLA